MISHRVAGSQVAIKAHIDALIDGNYDYERDILPTDELTEIVEGLEKLRAVLKERESR